MPPSDDKKKFAIYMAMLGTAFGDKGITTARIDIYWDCLKDIPVDMIGAAVKDILKTRKFSTIPTIAEIREAALGRDDDIETSALVAWGRALSAVERGRYLTEDPLISEAVRVAFGGWAKFGETDIDSTMADRAHFIRVFKGLARKRRDMGQPALEAHDETKRLKVSVRQLVERTAEAMRGEGHD